MKVKVLFSFLCVFNRLVITRIVCIWAANINIFENVAIEMVIFFFFFSDFQKGATPFGFWDKAQGKESQNNMDFVCSHE